MGKFLQGLRSSRKSRSGFTLIELAIVLAITSLLAAGLWRMMATGNSQLRDKAAADQHKALLEAVRGYLASPEGYGNVEGAAAAFNLPLPPAATGVCAAPYAGFCPFLPLGFRDDTPNSYGQTYEIQVLPVLNGATLVAYSFMIKTTAGDVIPDTSGGRISSMIGNDGGFVYTSDVCGGGGGAWACGAYGAWQEDPTEAAGFAFGAAAGGQIASRTFVGLNASLNTPWLARQDIPNDALTNDVGDFNTMRTNLSLGENMLTSDGSFLSVDPGPRIDLISPASAGANGNTLLRINNDCNDLTLVSTCEAAVEIHGRVISDGLFSATALYADQFVYKSDERLKRDIVRLDGSLNRLAKMRGYSFYYKDGESRHLGVIAQEVEKAFPESVMDIGQGYKGVDYISLIGPIIEAVNELHSKNEALAAQVESLEKKLAAQQQKAAKKK